MKQDKILPPKWATWLLKLLCSDMLIEEIEGDLLEEFNYQIQMRGVRFARWDYVRNVLSFNLRSKKQPNPRPEILPILMRHYFVVAFRNFIKQKSFSFINVAGLTLGMSASLIVIMLVSQNLQYDNYNTKRDRIYRIITYGEKWPEATTPFPLLDELIEKYPGIENSVRFNGWFGNVIGFKLLENASIPVAGFYVSPEVFDFFEYELEYGDPLTALVEPYSVVLTKNTARKLFKDENPVGETIQVGDVGMYKVTGVLKETSKKSHINFEALASLATVKSLQALKKKQGADLPMPDNGDWQFVHGTWTYVLLAPGKSVSDIQTALDEISSKHYSNLAPLQSRWKFNLQRLKDITPAIGMGNEIGPVLNYQIIYFISGVALAILAVSTFNFTNLSIARSLSRAKEIGLRKVTGASRWQIFVQFLSEAVLFSWVGLLLAFILIVFTKKMFLDLTLIRMVQWDLAVNIWVFCVAFIFATLVGIIAGLFPAAVLSQFTPVKILRNLSNVKVLSRTSMRKALIVAQFTVAIVFTFSAIVVYNQIELFLSKDHGFDMKNNIMIRLHGTAPELLKTELLKYPSLTDVSAASYLPATFFSSAWGNVKNPKHGNEWHETRYYSVDADYLRNMGVPLIAGRFFSNQAGNSNRNFVVINEAAVKQLHFDSPNAAIGQSLLSQFAQRDSSNLEVVGVVKDYNHSILTEKIGPLMLICAPEQYQILQVKYSGSYDKASEAIEQSWKKMNQDKHIDYITFEDEIFKFYDWIVGDFLKILLVMACFAVMICSLGLLGIVSYATETRVKEISIRKICGCSDSRIVFLLSKSFLGLIIVSILLGIPAGYFLNNLWLENIAYHTSAGPGVIVTAIAILMTVGILTISSQTIDAACRNPVDSLKAE